jgi:hypothetical protein
MPCPLRPIAEDLIDHVIDRFADTGLERYHDFDDLRANVL